MKALSALAILTSPAHAQTPVEPPWTSQDIGNPAVAGSATGGGKTFSVEAAGSDIWGSSDQFHFVYQPVMGDADIIARVDSLQATNVWSKAGVMIRESLSPGSKHAFALVSGAQGAALEWRAATGGTTQLVAGASSAAPYWLRLQRSGHTFRAYGATDDGPWRLMATQTITMTGAIYVGLAVTSHDTAATATARFSTVRLFAAGGNQPPTVQLTAPDGGDTFEAPASIQLAASASDSDGSIARVDFYDGSQLLGNATTSPYAFTASNVPAGSHTFTARATDNDGVTVASAPVTVSVETGSSGALPPPWLSQDVGGPALAGGARYDSTRFIVEGAGTDIWGTADQFHFVHQRLTGDGEIVARVDGIVRTNVWAKAGVMMRETPDGGSKHAYAMTSASYGAGFQRRAATGGTSQHTSGTVTAMPWVRLQREGSTFSAYESVDGASWRLMGSQTIAMASTIYVGLAVTSHDPSLRTSATLSNVRVTSGPAGGSAPFGGTPAPVPGIIQGENFDVGANGVAYRDHTAGNAGGRYRSTDVDIEITSDADGGYDVGWAGAGEWLAYTVNVASAGTYTLEVRVASNGTGGSFHVDASGANVTGSLFVPNTGGWQSWRTISRTVTLGAGVQVLRLVLDSNGPTNAVGNFNYVRLTAGSANTPPAVAITSPGNGAAVGVPMLVPITATASDADGSVARVDFYAGGTLVGSDTTSPYSAVWNLTATGSYTLTARATDNTGLATTSAAVVVSANPTWAAFVPPPDHATGVSSYLLEIFTAGDDPSTATPVRALNIGKPTIADGEIRVDVSSTIQPLAAGTYFGTMTAIRSTGSARSAPSPTFDR